MEPIINQGKRSAIPSWSGYQYQGHIAIVVTLIQLIQLKTELIEIEKYDLVLEEIEDFSIYKDGKIVSLHQVKAEKKDKISGYAEALYYMAFGLTDSSIGSKTEAYLHTASELQYQNWNDEVKKAVDKFEPEKQKELNDLLKDANQMNKKVTLLKENFSKSTRKFDRRIGRIWNQIYDSMKVEQAEDITVENLKEAIEKYVQNIQPVSVSNFLSENRIKHYKYENNYSYIPVSKTEEIIEALIEQYWGEMIAKQREGNVKYYRFAMQEIICSYVSRRHEDERSGVKITFTVFVEVLDKVLEMTEETRLLFNKDIFFRKKREYCKGNCQVGDQCDACDLNTKINWFGLLSNSEIKNAFYMMSPDVRDDIHTSSVNLLHENGLKESVFRTLKDMEYAETDQAGRIFYEKEKMYLLTDIEVSRNTKKSKFKDLNENNTIESICDEILKNKDFAFERMEIDSLIIYNGEAEIEIEDIAMLNSDTTDLEGMRDMEKESGKEPSYARITQKKQVSMIDAVKFIKERRG